MTLLRIRMSKSICTMQAIKLNRLLQCYLSRCLMLFQMLHLLLKTSQIALKMGKMIH